MPCSQAERIRNDTKPPITEESWTYQFNELFRKEYKLRTPLRAVFIDTYYDPKNPKESSQFQENTDKLWNFAKNNNPFECKDIKIALTEIRELNNEINVSLCLFSLYWITFAKGPFQQALASLPPFLYRHNLLVTG